MKYCLNCGKECCDILCESCQNTADIERLCLEISGYDVSSGENELWNRLASELQNPGNFRYAAFALAGFLASPRREYIQLRSLMNGYFLGTRSYNWLQAIAPGMLESDSLSVGEKEDVRGVLLGSYYSTHEYEKAEAVANDIGEPTMEIAAIHLGEYLIRTRRYDRAENKLRAAVSQVSDKAKVEMQKLLDNIAYRRNGKEYLPASRENKEAYIKFMNSLGVPLEMPAYRKDSVPEKMSQADYPEFIIERNADFRSFVAYDLETTGLSSAKDVIIEIGAVRVVDGEITEQFQTFVKPYKKAVSDKVTELTGISKDMVESAPTMWDAFNLFADFIRNDIVTGYNNTAFDNKFLARAGRYAVRPLKNRFFDVKTWAKEHGSQLECEGLSLGELSQYLNITNPKAHRALADAETTARVYLELLERFGTENTSTSLDEQLDEEWV